MNFDKTIPWSNDELLYYRGYLLSYRVSPAGELFVYFPGGSEYPLYKLTEFHRVSMPKRLKK